MMPLVEAYYYKMSKQKTSSKTTICFKFDNLLTANTRSSNLSEINIVLIRVYSKTNSI